MYPLYSLQCKEMGNLCFVHLVNTGVYDSFPIMSDDAYLFCVVYYMYIDYSDGRVVFVCDNSS